MEIEYTLKKEDIIVFNMYQNFQSPEGRKRKRNRPEGQSAWGPRAAFPATKGRPARAVRHPIAPSRLADLRPR